MRLVECRATDHSAKNIGKDRVRVPPTRDPEARGRRWIPKELTNDHVCRRRVAILLGGRKKKERKRRKGKREKRAVSLSVEPVFLVGKRRKEEKSRDERDAVHRRACY
mgnify:CR=1 FL=1